jgi:hypothetical protein
MVLNLILGGIEQIALPWVSREEPFDVDASAKGLSELVFRAVQV